MTSSAKIGQGSLSGGSGIRLTELPDPPQIPDMATQMPDICRAHEILKDYFAPGDRMWW